MIMRDIKDLDLTQEELAGLNGDLRATQERLVGAKRAMDEAMLANRTAYRAAHALPLDHPDRNRAFDLVGRTESDLLEAVTAYGQVQKDITRATGLVQALRAYQARRGSLKAATQGR